MSLNVTDKETPLACSFCDKDQFSVRRLIIGKKGVAICDGCTVDCLQVILRRAEVFNVSVVDEDQK